MDQYFNRIEYLQKKKTELSARVRFMLQDVVELRKNKVCKFLFSAVAYVV